MGADSVGVGVDRAEQSGVNSESGEHQIPPPPGSGVPPAGAEPPESILVVGNDSAAPGKEKKKRKKLSGPGDINTFFLGPGAEEVLTVAAANLRTAKEQMPQGGYPQTMGLQWIDEEGIATLDFFSNQVPPLTAGCLTALGKDPSTRADGNLPGPVIKSFSELETPWKLSQHTQNASLEWPTGDAKKLHMLRADQATYLGLCRLAQRLGYVFAGRAAAKRFYPNVTALLTALGNGEAFREGSVLHFTITTDYLHSPKRKEAGQAPCEERVQKVIHAAVITHTHTHIRACAFFLLAHTFTTHAHTHTHTHVQTVRTHMNHACTHASTPCPSLSQVRPRSLSCSRSDSG